jgi:hypothetical protein
MNLHLLWKQSRHPPIIWAQAGGLRKCTAWSSCTGTSTVLADEHENIHESENEHEHESKHEHEHEHEDRQKTDMNMRSITKVKEK